MKKFILALVLVTASFGGVAFADEPSVAHGQVAVAAPAQSTEAPKEEAKQEENSIISALKKVDEKIPLGLPGWVLLATTFLVELLMRFVPTSKPRSVLILLALGMNLLGSIFMKLSSLLDKIAQNVKPEKK